MFLQLFRSWAIFRLALTFLLDYWSLRGIDKRRRGDARDAARARVFARAGARFRKAAFRLQGLIVKVGQFLSTRTDVLPASFTRELSQLQDAVPAASFRHIRPLIESELGTSLSSVFYEFEEAAIAAASLGQVHRAKLADGQAVAVKVIRPGIERLAQIDLKALHRVVQVLYRVTKFGRRMNLPSLYTEFAAMVRQELDYRMEAENLKRFQRQFATDSRIVIPRLHDEYVSRRVLIMEFLDGAKISDVPRFESWGVSSDKMVKVLLDAYLQQVLVHGFIHVDPHPGNLLVLSDGRLGIIDFGMMSEIPRDEMSLMARLTRAAVMRDLDTVIKLVDELGFLQPHADRAFLKRALGHLHDRISGIELKKGKELDDFLADFQTFLHDEPIIVQAKYMFLGRAVGLLSGVVSTLAPTFMWTSFLQERALPLVGDFADSTNQRTSALRRRMREIVANLAGDPTAAAVDLAFGQAQETFMSLVRIPGEFERVMQKAERGELSWRLDLDDVLWRLERQERMIFRVFWFGCATVSGFVTVWLYTKGLHLGADIGAGATALGLLVVLASLLRRSKHRPRRTLRRG